MILKLTSLNKKAFCSVKNIYRELKHPAFLLLRRPTGTKLSADIAYLNTSCGRGDLHGGLQAAFCLHVGLSELRSFFYQRNGFKNKSSINLSK